MNRTGRLISMTMLVTALLVTAAPAASAHGSNNQPIPDAEHYLSQISGISPATPGLTASIDPRGEWIEVSNTTGKTLIILGYVREPYLRIDQAGVSENQYSPTLALNQSLFSDLSQLGDSSLPAAWNTTSSGTTARWHDHRIHWMTADRPPAVQAQPEVGTLIGSWTVHMTLDDQPIEINGTLSWLPIQTGLSLFGFIIPMSMFVLFVVALAWVLLRSRARNRKAGDDLLDHTAGGETPPASSMPAPRAPRLIRASPAAEPFDHNSDSCVDRAAQARNELLKLSEELAETRLQRSRLPDDDGFADRATRQRELPHSGPRLLARTDTGRSTSIQARQRHSVGEATGRSDG